MVLFCLPLIGAANIVFAGGEHQQALKLLGVPTQMVRIQNASHGIAGSSPSNLIAKIANVLEWFERYRSKAPEYRGASGG